MHYSIFINNPLISLNKMIMVLGASYEFEKRHNPEIVERLSDNEEVPAVCSNIS